MVEFSHLENFVIDARGFKHLLLSYAASFLNQTDTRVLLNKVVTGISYAPSGIVIKAGRDEIIADYAICTFSYVLITSHDPSVPANREELN